MIIKQMFVNSFTEYHYFNSPYYISNAVVKVHTANFDLCGTSSTKCVDFIPLARGGDYVQEPSIDPIEEV